MLRLLSWIAGCSPAAGALRRITLVAFHLVEFVRSPPVSTRCGCMVTE